MEGKWTAAPDISLRGSFVERSRSSRSKVKFMFFFLFVPLLLPGPWADLHQTWAAPDISSRGSFFKGQGHRGQRSNFCISAVHRPIRMKLGECVQVDP